MARTPDTAERLLRAAEAEFVAHGGALQMLDVARRAGLSVGSAYHHFGSKAGLVAAVVGSFYEPLRAIAFAPPAEPDGDWLAVERDRFAQMVRYLMDHPLAPAVLGHLEREHAVRDLENAYTDDLLREGAKNLVLGQRRGVVDGELDPGVTVAQLFGGLKQAVQAAHAGGIDTEVVVANVWRFVGGALGVRRVAVGEADEVGDAAVYRYFRADHAGRHQQLAPSEARSSPEIEADFAALMRDGFVILESVVPLETCEAIRAETARLLGHVGRNAFEGLATQRVYNVLGKTRVTDALATHPRILGLLDKLFQPNSLLSQSQIIHIQPGEAAQLLHVDDAFYRVRRPRPALGAATVWAIDDFTADNGATVVVPGSHTWGEGRVATPDEAVPAVMPAGSVVFFLGTTWHGGGENRSDRGRLAVTHQYCAPFVRQQENYLLELDRETVRQLSPELRALVGYSIFPPFMGMVDGMHPLRLLEG
jgi:ectoine hydroxylase-related dioxygenase (phytanoyl-CoA dioxygenase family)/AcrR family transcriptional regulator